MYNYTYVQFLINKYSHMYVYIDTVYVHALLYTDDGFGEVEAERLDSLCIRMQELMSCPTHVI